MTDELTRAAEAALAWANDFYPNSKTWDSRDGNAYKGFLAGANWAFESEAVRGLIEDLKLIQSMNGRNDGCSYCARIAHKALSNWNEMRGEK